MKAAGTEREPLKIAVVGSGPSGFYATEALIKSGYPVEISMFERLPAPYGLVRSGVAPDHPKLKQAIQVYAGIAESPCFVFFGNVMVGKDISIEELRGCYHALIVTCGAEADRRLGIPGEDLPGSHTATEFVGWYNGHPDYRDRSFDLSHETAVIIGQGNVAADVSRILAKTVAELEHTDIAGHALEVLTQSNIRNIYVIGRRGPAQAKFTSKELKEFGELQNCTAIVNPQELELNPESAAELAEKTNAGGRKVFELFTEFSRNTTTAGKNRKVIFTFLKSPVEITGTGRVEKITFEINHLTGEPFRQAAAGTGKFTEISTGLVFRSIGYRGVPIPGLPFDDRRGIIPNENGRVVDGKQLIPDTYVSGWIKRGPTGIIGTNRADSVSTVNALIEDINRTDTLAPRGGAEAARSLLDRKGIRYVNFSEWKKIDRYEIDRGRPKGKPREKFTFRHEMLEVLDR